MTKIKNTKKGMAKKTLSMSLVVAMLATSNVPVWAAEFSDGTDAAVASEAQTAEAFSDEADATPVVEDTAVEAATETVSSNAYDVKPTFTNLPNNKTVVWTDSAASASKKVSAKFTVTAADGTNTTDITYYYAWKIGGAASTETSFNLNAETTAELTLTDADAGKTAVLFIYAKDNTGTTTWHYESDAIQIKAAQDTELDKLKLSSAWKPVYNGKDQVVTADNIDWSGVTGWTSKSDKEKKEFQANYKISVSGETKDVTDDGVTVTIESQRPGYTGSKKLNYTIEPLELDGTTNKKISEHFKATLKTTNFKYTGNVIRVKAADVTLTDIDTGEDLSNYLQADDKGYVSLKNTAVQEKGEYILTLNLINGQPEKGTKNYTIKALTASTSADPDGYRTVKTSNKATVVARDLADVNISIKPMAIPANGILNDSNLLITYTDKDTNEVLSLGSSVVVSTVTGATTKGDYKVTIAPKPKQYNVIGDAKTATATLVAADLSSGKFEKGYGTGTNDKKNNVLKAEEYTGSAVTKTEEQLGDFTVDGKIIDKSLYTIEYVNNTNARAMTGSDAVLIVKGKGNYEGSTAVFTFKINQAKVKADTVTTEKKVEEKDTQNASDYKDSLGLVVKAKNANGKEFTLVNGTDYTVKYSYKNDANKTATKGGVIVATITVTNKNFVIDNSGSTTIVKEVPISHKVLKSENIKLAETSFTYNGKVVEPDFDIVVDGHYKALTDQSGNKLFDYTFTNNINAGTATLTVTPTANNTEFDKDVSAKATFEIKPADASKLVGVIASRQYTGYSLEIPSDEINLKLGDDVIDAGDNFKLTYGENRSIGQGTVTLTPKNGNFTGTKTVTFDIVGKLLNSGTITGYDANGIETDGNCTYDGAEHKFAKVVADIKDGNKKLVEGTDYDLVYVDNVYGKKGTKTVGSKPVDVQRGAVLAIAKGTYGGSLNDSVNGVVKGVYTDAAGNKIANVIAIKTFEIEQLSVDNSSIVVKNATYAGGLSLKPEVTIVVKGVTLVEGKDYTLNVDGSKDLVNATTGKINKVTVTFKNGYKKTTNGVGKDILWGIDKFDLANADVTVKDGKISVKCGKVEVDTADYTTTANNDGTTTVAAAKTSKNYTGSKTVKTNGATEAEKPAAPMISSVKVVGNKATAILSGDSDGAAGYDYVISTDRDCITNKDYASVNKNQVQTSTTFKYVQQGTYYAYCHAWKRDENGKKVFSDWSNAYPFVVSAITPDAPVITNVTVSGSTIKVTYKAAANATGYDVVLGTGSKKENGETRPYQYGNHKKLNLKEGTVTATFKNVPKGTWVVGMHAFNRTSEDGKKVFSPWSNLKKATVK